MNEQLYTSENEWIVASIEYNKRVGGSTVFYKQIDVVVLKSNYFTCKYINFSGP